MWVREIASTVSDDQHYGSSMLGSRRFDPKGISLADDSRGEREPSATQYGLQMQLKSGLPRERS